eukprot:267676-Ditylum_brightwellii.AAC.1
MHRNPIWDFSTGVKYLLFSEKNTRLPKRSKFTPAPGISDQAQIRKNNNFYFTAEIFSKTTAKQQVLHCITMLTPCKDIEGTYCISVASGSISNTHTLNVLPFGAGMPAASDRITIASDTGNSNSSGHSSRLTRSSFHGQGGIGV